MIKLFSIALVFFLFSCDNPFQNNALPDKALVTPVIIDVQPFDDVPKEKVDFVVAELKKVYPNITLKKPVQIPVMDYYSKRNRYRADSIVSCFRLSKKNTLEQYFKVSIHEVGHTQGLPHCPEKTCFMRDADGKNHTDEETEFCEKCKAHLVSKGWTFKK